MKQDLLKKIELKTAKIGIIGLGYVGLPLAIECAKKGFHTVGLDVNNEKIQSLLTATSYVDDVKDQEIEAILEKNTFVPSTDFSMVKDLEILIICVPTPLDNHYQPNVKYIQHAGNLIAEFLSKNSVVVLESTTYPGTTRELLKPILESTGKICEQDFYLGFSPERVDPGNKLYTTKNTPKVVSGIGADALEVIESFYKEVLESEIHKVSTPEIAEMEKLLENTYRNINIGLINELTILCEKMKINVWEVIEAAKTKPYGFQAFYPGPGLGGHCIPLDPYYLSWKAKEQGFHTSMIESSMLVNNNMANYIVSRITKLLNKRKKSLHDSKILLLGMAYKKDISDYRESPAIDIMLHLKTEFSKVDFYDPYVQSYKHQEKCYQGLTTLDKEQLAQYDLVVITTDHSVLDYSMIQKNAKVIFDTRNATKDVEDKNNIELL